jgi:hypothetical protein
MAEPLFEKYCQLSLQEKESWLKLSSNNYNNSISNSLRLRSAAVKFANIKDYNSPMAVTLTHRRRHRTRNQGITQFDCGQNLRHFLNKLNRKLYGRKGLNDLMKLPVFPVLERDQSNRYHYHLLLDCPPLISKEEMAAHIHAIWPNTNWGYNHYHINIDQHGIKTADDGWLWYITKLRSKEDYGQSFDWPNFHAPPPAQL